MSGEANPHNAIVVGLIDKDGTIVSKQDQQAPSEVFRLIISAGADKEVREGMRILIFALGPEIFDPRTSESLGRFEIVKGTGKVASVQERMCTIYSEATRTVLKQRPASAYSMIAGMAPDFQEIEQKAPFRDPLIGDFARFI